jgi:hypothetical protein
MSDYFHARLLMWSAMALVEGLAIYGWCFGVLEYQYAQDYTWEVFGQLALVLVTYLANLKIMVHVSRMGFIRILLAGLSTASAWIVWGFWSSGYADPLENTFDAVNSSDLIALSLLFVTGLAVADWSVMKMIDSIWSEPDPLVPKRLPGGDGQDLLSKNSPRSISRAGTLTNEPHHVKETASFYGFQQKVDGNADSGVIPARKLSANLNDSVMSFQPPGSVNDVGSLRNLGYTPAGSNKQVFSRQVQRNGASEFMPEANNFQAEEESMAFIQKGNSQFLPSDNVNGNPGGLLGNHGQEDFEAGPNHFGFNIPQPGNSGNQAVSDFGGGMNGNQNNVPSDWASALPIEKKDQESLAGGLGNNDPSDWASAFGN